MKTKTRFIAIALGAAAIAAAFFFFLIKPQQGAEKSKTLVLYFSRGENIPNAAEYLASLDGDVDAMTSASVLAAESGETTGNLGLLARWIAEEADADLCSIKVKTPYPQGKKDTQNIVLQEQLDGVWPEVMPSTVDVDEYDTVFLGFPNWYAEPPRALYSFLKENDLDGKTIIPFTSDDKNGFSDAVDILRSKLPNSAVLSAEDGLLVNRKVLFDSKELTQEWVKTAMEKAAEARNDPLSTSEGQRKAAEALIGQTLTDEEIRSKLGEYTKFSKGTNG